MRVETKAGNLPWTHSRCVAELQVNLTPLPMLFPPFYASSPQTEDPFTHTSSALVFSCIPEGHPRPHQFYFCFPHHL